MRCSLCTYMRKNNSVRCIDNQQQVNLKFYYLTMDFIKIKVLKIVDSWSIKYLLKSDANLSRLGKIEVS